MSNPFSLPINTLHFLRFHDVVIVAISKSLEDHLATGFVYNEPRKNFVESSSVLVKGGYTVVGHDEQSGHKCCSCLIG